jgi:hypothetical protein
VRSRSLKRGLVTGAVALLVLGAVGLVYAQWIASGNGHGYAKAGEATSLSTIDVSAEVSTSAGLLYPGGEGDVLVQVHNPNPYPVTVTEVRTGAGGVTAAGGTGVCETTGVSLNSPQAVSIEAPAEGDSAEVTIAGAVQMSNASEDGCQGATFTIPVELIGVSSAP